MKKFGFTLAEVLITLAIIGIVAALTIPTLVTNYQKKQWVAGLQKGYATLNNVFRLAMADDGVDNITQTSLWQSIPADASGYRWTIKSNMDYSDFVANLQKYLKINKFCNPTENKNECFSIEYKLLNGSNEDGDLFKAHNLKLYSADGIVYYFRLYGKDNDDYLQTISIDVNGDNPPNQHGRDLFDVVTYNNGRLIFAGTNSWDNGQSQHWDEGDYACDPINAGGAYLGDYCGARVFENGWKMDY